jgi:RNA polymerase sigma-70 factor (ECF subfamily)
MSNADDLLKRLSAGDTSAADELLPAVYDYLRGLAGRMFRQQPHGHTLEPTALVHEAYLKLIRSEDQTWKDRAHFLAVASLAMRQILHDRARRRRAEKHGGHLQRVSLSPVGALQAEDCVDLEALDGALDRLAQLNERQSRIVELRFFGGLNVKEVGEVLGVSASTVEKEWARTRAWLSRELAGETR